MTAGREEHAVRTELTEEQRDTLRAAANRIVPADDYPDAWTSGAGEFIEKHLKEDLRRYSAVYRDGLDALDEAARAVYGRAFAALAPLAQDTLLMRADAGARSLKRPQLLQRFFRALVNHVAESYYSDPSGGGNRDAGSWRMLGFTGGADWESRELG